MVIVGLQMSVPMENPKSQTLKEAPWKVGFQAARANLIPALIVQGIMLALVLGYYFWPPTARWLNELAQLKQSWGYGYSALSAALAGGLAPEIMRVLMFQKGRPLTSNATNLLFTLPFWGCTGMMVDFFYRMQAQWFGAEATFQIVAIKVTVDQFIFNPLFAGPSGAWFYDWKLSGCSFKNTKRFLTATYYREVIVPILFATWGVWIPLVAILYSLPSLLQIPLFGLALAMWVMLFTWISEQRPQPGSKSI
jgi:hypothetical protein